MSPHTWLPIFGSVDVSDGKVTLIPIPSPPTTPNTPVGVPLAVARSNIEFEQGIVEFQGFLPTSDSLCQIGFGSGTQAELFAGLNVLGAPYGFAVLVKNKWETLSTSGQGSSLIAGRTYDIKVSIQGSNLELFVDGVMVAATTYRFARGALSLLLQSSGPVAASNFRVKTQQPVCFVVMQFTDEFNVLYSEVIKPTCEEFKYKVVRADDFYTSGLIVEDIIRSIRESTLVIADVTPNNANVFYEVGFAHGIGKPTILLSDRKREKLPFDISGFRTLFYDNTIGGKGAVEEHLRRHLEALGA